MQWLKNYPRNSRHCLRVTTNSLMTCWTAEVLLTSESRNINEVHIWNIVLTYKPMFLEVFNFSFHPLYLKKKFLDGRDVERGDRCPMLSHLELNSILYIGKGQKITWSSEAEYLKLRGKCLNTVLYCFSEHYNMNHMSMVYIVQVCASHLVKLIILPFAKLDLWW